MPRKFQSRRTFGRKRRTEWQDAGGVGIVTVPAPVGNVLALQLAGPDERGNGKTLLRIVGNVVLNASVTTGEYAATAGIIVVTEEARAAGAFPEPRSDEADWLYMRQFYSRRVLNEPATPSDWQLDIHAKRKWGDDKVVELLFESAGNPSTIGVSLNLRLLFALP